MLMRGPEFLGKLKRQFKITGIDDRVVELLAVALLSGGHVLLECEVELAKILVKVLADSAGLAASIIPPELVSGLAVQISQTSHSHQEESRAEKSPLSPLANIVFICANSTGSTSTELRKLLEVLEMVEKEEVLPEHFPEPFMVMASSSLFDDMSNFQDIFMMKVKIGAKGLGHIENVSDSGIESISDRETVLSLMDQAKLVWAGEAIFDYIYEIALKIRADERVAAELSHKASEHLLFASRALAFLRGRNYVLPDDVKCLAEHLLSHRLVLRPEWRMKGLRAEDLVREILDEVEVPK